MNPDTSISQLPRTRSLTIQRLKKLNINSLLDLLYYFPFRYEDYSSHKSIAHLTSGEAVTVRGVVIASKNYYTRNNIRIQKITIQDATGAITIVWFNQPYLVRLLSVSKQVSVSGKVVSLGNTLTIQPAEYEITSEGNFTHTGRLVPIYSEKRGLTSRTIREKIALTLSKITDIKELLPTEILKAYSLLPLDKALQAIHFPVSKTELATAKKRLSFDELFMLQLGVHTIQKKWRDKTVSNRISITPSHEKHLQRFITSLPFQLTVDQTSVLNEIKSDLLKNFPMNRFLQGDVGSGKTIVALISAYLCALSGYQTLFMVPTEILAKQHAETCETYLKPFHLNTVLLTSRNKSEAQKLLNKSHIIVGTQALLSDKIIFKKVGLVIIDEQHRFGVRQRALLQEKGIFPHTLSMTATPIPRTIALTLFNELSLSIINNSPEGRIPVKTYVVPNAKRTSAYDWIKSQIVQNGSQVFIVCPRIEETEEETNTTVRAAKKEFLVINSIFAPLKVGLLHGKSSVKEKNRIMSLFQNNKINILVTTSVVEVGIDIPNATIILIEGSERFGLAQLHQLRGRVGRGKKQSYCLLFTDSFSEEKAKRLLFFSKNTSGRKLAEFDMQQRGSGNIFGLEQHGFLKLNIADLNDLSLVRQSKQAVSEYLQKYPQSLHNSFLNSKLASYISQPIADN